MRWLPTGVAVIFLAALSGCPSEFGRDGRVAKAIRKDSAELVSERCSDEKIEEVCAEGKEESPDCEACFQ
ncbi:hypothetical protein [Stigmatella erecta]|uniref:Uncharacterized protein n=1 Tax=Stigmatella erecta TaxID=83460 RepID=A0A1I0KZ83_9BACT|nr:hypothetical protein [Stigmatella erecta]SEU31655.1 hypothetical protein SAMN05443639_11674 [Stigmatella erecta]